MRIAVRGSSLHVKQSSYQYQHSCYGTYCLCDDATFYATHPKQHDMVYGISQKCLTAMAQARLLLIQVSKQYGVWCGAMDIA